MKERRYINIKWKHLRLTREEFEAICIGYLIFLGLIIQSLLSAKMIVGLITYVKSKASMFGEFRLWFLFFDLLNSAIVIYIVTYKESALKKVFDEMKKCLRLVTGRGEIR